MKVLFFILIFLVACTGEDTEETILRRINKNIVIEDGMYNLKEDIKKDIASLYGLLESQDTPVLMADLNDDGIDEIIVYRGRNYEDIEDPGEIIAYSMVDGRYQKTSFPLVFDKGLKEMELGRISEEEEAVFIKTSVGKNYENFYVVVLREGVENLLKTDLLSYLSVIPEGSIGDINNNGITDFTIVMRDPDFGDEKIFISYEYNGNSFEIIRVDRKKEPSSDKFLDLVDEDIIHLEDLEDLRKSERTIILNKYIENLEKNMEDRKKVFVDNLRALGVEDIPDFILDYGIGNRSLNDPEFVEKSRAFSNKLPFKLTLTKLLRDGYAIRVKGGILEMSINYKYLEKQFELEGDYSMYLTIKGEEFFLKGEEVSYKNYKNLLDLMEEFLIKFPYSDRFKSIEKEYKIILKDLIARERGENIYLEEDFSFSSKIFMERERVFDGEKLAPEAIKDLFEKIDKGAL